MDIFTIGLLYFMALCDLIQFGLVWSGTVWYGMVLQGIFWFGLILFEKKGFFF